jgi:hypothetical protein
MSNIVIQFVPSQWLLRSFSFGRLRFIRQRRAEAKKEHYDAQERLFQDFLAGLDNETRRELLESANHAEQDGRANRREPDSFVSSSTSPPAHSDALP